MTSSSSPQGVAAILANRQNPPPRTALSLFSQTGRVALVTGAIRGIGLEIALALAEVGATVYCLDLALKPSNDWLEIQKYLSTLPEIDGNKNGRLEYICGDVTDQPGMWKVVEDIVKKEGRIDVCVANASILAQRSCLEYPAEEFQKVLNVNLNGALYTAQAAGREMSRLGIRGSIILIASMNGSIANKNRPWIAYNTSKSGVLQLARSMASELGSKGIRVNSVSPGFIYSDLNKEMFAKAPERASELASYNPLNRLGTTDELRGVVLWLAGEGSTFCTGSNVVVDGGHCSW